MAKVLLGMSGGLDSSVAALLLKEQGHTVIGMTIKTYSYDDVGGNAINDTSCCSLDGINDARRVAGMLGIPHYVTDMTELFGTEIIDYFKNTYLEGATPNPCVKCNREIKWAAMLKKADALGCDLIATGHYAGLRAEGDRMIISKAHDTEKDQTYALWAVREEHLHRTLFPLSDLRKDESRGLARKAGLPIADKRESYEICFVTDNDYRRFLRDNVGDLESQAPHGDFVLDGKVVGSHEGVPFYTVGQRKGLGISIPSHPAPLYVTGLDVVNNSVTLGDNDDLLSSALTARDPNLLKYGSLPAEGIRVTAKIRYRDEGVGAFVKQSSDGRLHVKFDVPRRAITPGQSLVMYEGNDMIGGAVIELALA